MNYLGKPTQGKAFAVVTLTKPKSRHDLARTDRCIPRRDRTKKPSPSRAQRDARSAYKIDRDAAGGVVDLVRLSGAKKHRFSRSDQPLCLAPSLRLRKLCEAQRAEHRLWLLERPAFSHLRSRSRLRRRLQPARCCAVALCDPQSSTGSEFKPSHSLERHDGLCQSPASGGSRQHWLWIPQALAGSLLRPRALRLAG